MNSLRCTFKSRRARITAVVLVAFAVAVVPAGAKLIEIGETDAYPAPACPHKENCRVIAQITGYQIQIGEKKNPFRVTANGKLVAITLNLPQNSKDEIKYFNENRGGPPSAQVSILRPRPRRGVKYRYVLAGASEKIELSRYLGSEPTFALKRPLTVKKNDVVAVTTDTWMPAFSTAVDASTIWRASRSSKECDDVTTPAEHVKTGEIRSYGCGYKNARILYHASIIANPTPTSK